MIKLITFSAALAALGAATIVLAPAAHAGAAALRIGDLDLTSEAGKSELARRIDAAVLEACPAETVTGSRIANRSARDACIADARKQIEAHVAKIAKRAG